MPKPQDIFQLAQQEAVRVTASPQAWRSFLYTAAHNYHTTYLNQLLIHAQRPDAAACASMEYWNTKANRLVMRGSRSITVLQRRQGVAVTKPVFAIGDTTLLSQTHTGGPWEVTDTTRPLLLQGKPDDWLSALAQDGISTEADRARRMMERNVADSTLQWAQPDEQMQLLQALVTQSAVYIARLRIGLPVRDEDYPALQSVSQFDTCQISLCLGGYLQAAAEPMLNAIGREALRLNRDSIAIPHEPVHNESTPTQLNSREEAVTHDVHEEPRRLPDSEPFPAEPAEPVPEPLREAASGISGAERADALRPADAGGHAADELQPNRTDSTADGGQDPARADADHPDAGPQNEPAGLGTADQQPEKAGGGSSPSDAVRNLTESPAQAESEPSPSAFALPEFPPTLLPQLLAAETSSRASNAEYLTFYNKNPLLIDRLRFVRESYKDIFTELLLADDTRVGFHRQDNGLLVWQGAYLTRSAETLLPWRAVANALNDLIEQHELIAAIDPKELPQVEEQLSFELPDGSPPSAENDRLEKDDFLTPEKQETVIRSALPVAEYNAPQMDDGSVITDEEINLALAAGSNFENSKFRIFQQFTTTQGDHAAFLKKEYGSGGRSWDYQSGAHGWVDHGPAGLKLILTNEEGRFERRLPWRAAAKRIAYLIEMQRFLTPQELEQYPAWAAEQRKVASVVRDEPGNVPDTRPICAEGCVVYLEDDHRFTVERIGQFDVHLRDEEVPLVGRAISREEFQRQLDANPRNGGMMLSEQQHEALVQTQTEQALSYTNEEGILTLPEKLPLGKYRIVETVGPDGFYNEWADSGNYYVDFDISTDRIYKATGDDNENGMDTLVIGEDYWNEETLGKLTIRKTGEALTGKIETNDLIDPWMTGEADSDFVYTLRPLAGAEYAITAAEDIYTQDRQLDANGSRTLWYAKGDVVAVVTTGDGSADTAVFAPSRTKATYDFLSVIHDGTLGEVSITLPLGSYHVEETKPPYGYVGTTDSYDVTFVWDNQLNDVVMEKSIVKNGDSEQHFDVVRASEASAELAEQQTLGFYNDREHARVGVYKINQETDKYLAGAVFNLYTRDDIYDVDGNKLFSAGDLICTSPETVADGYTYFNCDVPIRGEWYGQSDRLDASTNSGNYFIRELRAPLGYYLNDAEMDVTFTYDGEVLQVLDNTCANKPTEMWVSKRDLTNDEELPGATLVIKDAKDNIVDTWVSTDTPHRVTGLHFDEEYTLTEKRPADGYAVADDIVFRLERKTDADGHELDEADVYYLKDKKKLWIISWEKWELLDDATVIMKDDITRVQISKIDIATGKELPGAELVIKDTDGNTVAQWVSEDKPHYIEKLPAGDYALTEITAPNGYQLAESIAFTVLPTGELQTVVMKDAHIPEETPHEDTPSNTPQPTPGSTPAPTPAPASAPTTTPAPMPVIPQTGDVFPFALLSAAVFGSIVGFGIFAYKRRKSKLDESEH